MEPSTNNTCAERYSRIVFSKTPTSNSMDNCSAPDSRFASENFQDIQAMRKSAEQGDDLSIVGAAKILLQQARDESRATQRNDELSPESQEEQIDNGLSRIEAAHPLELGPVPINDTVLAILDAEKRFIQCRDDSQHSHRTDTIHRVTSLSTDNVLEMGLADDHISRTPGPPYTNDSPRLYHLPQQLEARQSQVEQPQLRQQQDEQPQLRKRPKNNRVCRNAKRTKPNQQRTRPIRNATKRTEQGSKPRGQVRKRKYVQDHGQEYPFVSLSKIRRDENGSVEVCVEWLPSWVSLAELRGSRAAEEAYELLINNFSEEECEDALEESGLGLFLDRTHVEH